MTYDQSKKQVAQFNFNKNKWAIAALALFIVDVACVLLFGVIDSLIVFAIMAVLSIACLVCALQIKETSKTEQLVVIDNPYPVDIAKIEEGLPEGTKLLGRDGHAAKKDSDECFVMDAKSNALFVMKPIWADVPDAAYELPDDVLPYVAYLKAFRNESLAQAIAVRADKQVCGLASDIVPSLFESEHPTITVNVVSRYSVQVTDDAFDAIVVNKKKVSDKIVFDGRKLALDDDGHLKDFKDSKMCNEIDIKSLIVLSDGHMMFARGTDEHPLYPGRIVPPVSCSLLPGEIEQRPLQESMVESIHHKLRTSYAVPDGTEINTSFVGFSRMLPRGGAPEFYCLTRLDMTKDEIIAALSDSAFSFDDAPVVKLSLTEEDGYAGDVLSALMDARKKIGDDAALSLSALMSAVYGIMKEEKTARRVLRRLGMIDEG